MIAYWIAAMLVTAQILVSLDYDLRQATMMSLAFLPSALALSFFLPKVDRTLGRKERIQDTVFIVLGVMSMAFLLLFLLQVILFSYLSDSRRIWDFPSMLRNPFFIAAILALLAYGHYLLVTWLEKRFPSTYPITFNSEHRKISLSEDLPEEGRHPLCRIPRFRSMDRGARRPDLPQPQRHHPMGKPPGRRFPAHPSRIFGQCGRLRARLAGCRPCR